MWGGRNGFVYFKKQLTELKERFNTKKKLLSSKDSTFKICDFIEGFPHFIDFICLYK